MTHYLVTPAAGFFGSHVVRDLLGPAGPPAAEVTVLDAPTYAGDPTGLAPVPGDPRPRFVQGDITGAALVDRSEEAPVRPDSPVLDRGAPGGVHNVVGGTRPTNRELTGLLLHACGAGWDAVRPVEDRKGRLAETVDRYRRLIEHPARRK
jgi:dTDP-D-glucose 4,6-dehydratase